MTREISAANRSEHLVLEDSEIEALFRFLDTLNEPALASGDISIVFMDDEEHDKLHDDYLDDPTTTDVITFPGDEEMDFAGEIAVNVEQAWRLRENSSDVLEAESIDRDRQLFTLELNLYLIHGWLHLCGLEDKTDAGRAAMRNAEAIVIAACMNVSKLPTFNYSNP